MAEVAIAARQTGARSLILAGSNEFGLKTFQQLAAAADSLTNLIYSPISLSAVLTILYQGAREASAKKLAELLQLPSAGEAAAAYRDLKEHFKELKDVTVESAFATGIKKGLTFSTAFEKVCSAAFSSHSFAFDPSDPDATAEAVNNWVSVSTRKIISKLVSPDAFNEASALILINSVYFKGPWLHQFKPAATKTAPFFLGSDDAKIDVKMMKGLVQVAAHFYSDDLKADFVSLPYEGGDTIMLFVVPKEVDGLPQLEASLDKLNVQDAVSKLKRQNIMISVPSFKIESSVELKEPLSKLGLSVLFGDSADLGGLITEELPLKVDKVLQKAVIDVNEEGTEAAAATAAVIGLRSIPRTDLVIEVNRPFLCLLLNVCRAAAPDAKPIPPAILFIGRVAKPSAFSE